MREPPRISGAIQHPGPQIWCDQCGSSIEIRWIFFEAGCVKPECDNYFKKNDEAKRKAKERASGEIKPIEITHKKG